MGIGITERLIVFIKFIYSTVFSFRRDNMRRFSSDDLYGAFIVGANNVIANRQLLNSINVFPVKDGDTGTNLASMMKSLIRESSKEDNVKMTLESIAEAALKGARGNSGLIFAQYFNGLSIEITDDCELSIDGYIRANEKAVQHAYDAIDNPIEGTIITVMREWGNALKINNVANIELIEVLKNAVESVEIALERTKNQLDILRSENVVDSGAKGFTLFIQGILSYFTGENKGDVEFEKIIDEGSIYEINHFHESKYRYCTECVIEGANIDLEKLKEKIKIMGESLIVVKTKNMCKLHIHTDNPEEIFAKALDYGDISYQKVDDMIKQKDIVENRKYNIAVVTDSIADIPKDILDNDQIHIINLNLLFQDSIFLDRIGISNKRIFELIFEKGINPSSSQPNKVNIENFMDYLTNYYDELIILTVSDKLSGTYNVISKVIGEDRYKEKNIRLINTKLNSGAQGLIVKKCSDLVSEGLTIDTVVEKINKSISKSTILVKVPDIDNMVRSGRLSKGIGRLGKLIGMKPVVTLDNLGKGKIHSISFTPVGDIRSIVKHIRTVQKKNDIESYCISYVDDIENGLYLAKKIASLVGFPPDYIMETSTIVAVSAGKGSVAVSYILKEED